MKTPAYTFKMLLMLLAVTVACKKDTVHVSAYTQEWLQTKTDTKLYFTSHTGEKEELTIKVQKDTRTYSGKFGANKSEYYWLTYTGLQSDLGLIVVAEQDYLDIRNIGQPDFNAYFATLITAKNQADEQVMAREVEAELINNLDLNGTQYERVFRVKFNLPPHRPDKIHEIYYAKKHGLVYFQTIDGQYWSIDK
ncbi:hypothetical protein [uncultured Pontibacter sp.]|uniref:hypothetical protein n=1 Tax=uncultured Pontibacter sp. TaxID=453356 RepID=UPI002603324C|nr:hypothetical protein [uncultured Pontibacter sp.]